MFRTFSRFAADTSGAAAVDYGLLAAGLSIAILSTINALGLTLRGTFDLVAGTADPTLQ